MVGRRRKTREPLRWGASAALGGRRFLRTSPWLAVLCLWLVAARVHAGADDGSSAPHSWAVLVGVQNYTQAPRLVYTANDVAELATTLRVHGDLEADCLLQVTDEATSAVQPVCQTLREVLPAWLAKAGPTDTMLLYFSGHGFRAADGSLYLAPADFEPQSPADTGLSVAWLREQLASCQAALKLLVLDACHAGNEKGPADDVGLAGAELGEPFRDISGVVTIASSTGDEKSLLWDEKQQSLFSYWLNQALKGHADDNGDTAVDVDELYEYVHRQVTRTAQARFGRPQTPVRIVRTGTRGVPTVQRLRPLGLKQVLADMAEQLSWSLDARGLAKVGVLEFTNDTPLGELLGAEFGLLGRYCAEEIEARLTKSGGSYSVVDRRKLAAALAQRPLSIEQLGSTDALSALSERAGGMQAVALGTLRSRAGRVVTLQCKLLATNTDDLVTSVGGTAWLNESEWAMLGKSANLPLADRPSPGSGDPQDLAVITLDDRAKGPHPLADPNFPFRVAIKVGGQERSGTVQGNDYVVTLDKGEVYELSVENRSGELVLMRLLVDGLNTLPQPVRDEEKGLATFEVAARVNLDEARHWILDPAQNERFAIRGFVTEAGTLGKLRQFVVVDAAQSAAARKQFTDQVGLITAAFYAPRSDRAVGTDLGEEQSEVVTLRGGTQVGELLSVVHIRYVEGGGKGRRPRSRR